MQFVRHIRQIGLCFFLFCICGATVSAQEADFGQRIEIPASFNPVGSGARALGMGGAFISVADDATAASWNPAGLIQLEKPEISIVGSFVHRIEDNSFETHPEADGAESVDVSDLNYFSASYPFALWGYNMIVSLNWQHLYDMTRQWTFPIREEFSPDLFQNQSVDSRQEGSLSALGLACAVQITPDISLGFTLNVWDDDIAGNEWTQKTWQWGDGNYYGDAYVFESYMYDRYSLSGVNMNFGLLWNVNANLSLGAVLKTPFDADITHKHTGNYLIRQANPNIPDYMGNTDYEEDGTLSMPLSFGIGAAYRFSDRLTASLDIYRTQWDDFEYENSKGEKKSPITGKESDMDPTHQVRMGAEYLFILPQYVIPVRAGLFYDPAPAEGSPDDFYGFSIGSGIAWKRFAFDMAWQFRMGNDAGGAGLENWGLSQDVREHTLYTSIIVHF
ncbi:MAG: OmpP1/FadL family transporter [Desulfococcaceae bacterium]